SGQSYASAATCTFICPAGLLAGLFVSLLACIWQQVWSHFSLSGCTWPRLPILFCWLHLAASDNLSVLLQIHLQAAHLSICLFHRLSVNQNICPIGRQKRRHFICLVGRPWAIFWLFICRQNLQAVDQLGQLLFRFVRLNRPHTYLLH